MGTVERVIPPNLGHIQATDPAIDGFMFKAAAQTQTGWQIITSTTQPVRPGLRTLVLLRDGRPDYRGHKELIDLIKFNDYPPPPATSVASR